jgi:hypothetical protein
MTSLHFDREPSLGGILAVLLLWMGAMPAAAQEAAPLVPDFSTVRVESPVFSGVATVTRSLPDALELGLQGSSTPIVVPLAELTRLEVRRRATAWERASRGALWGAGIFGIMGVALTDRAEDVSGAEVFAFHAFAGAAIGGGIGLAIPRDRWDRVELRVRASVGR